jgi:hypothetical protein
MVILIQNKPVDIKPAKNDNGHTWKLDKDGKVDEMAVDVDDEDGNSHGGPLCSVCGYSYCAMCYPEGAPESCPKPKEL